MLPGRHNRPALFFSRRTSERARMLAGAAGVAALAKHGTNQHTPGGDNVTSQTKGNSAPYLVARLKRDAPAIAERLAAGEFRSARAAAIEAGIVKPESPLTTIRRTWKRISPADREGLSS